MRTGQAAQQSEFQTGQGSLEPEPAHSQQIVRGWGGVDKGLDFRFMLVHYFFARKAQSPILAIHLCV